MNPFERLRHLRKLTGQIKMLRRLQDLLRQLRDLKDVAGRREALKSFSRENPELFRNPEHDAVLEKLREACEYDRGEWLRLMTALRDTPSGEV